MHGRYARCTAVAAASRHSRAGWRGWFSRSSWAGCFSGRSSQYTPFPHGGRKNRTGRTLLPAGRLCPPRTARPSLSTTTAGWHRPRRTPLPRISARHGWQVKVLFSVCSDRLSYASHGWQRQSVFPVTGFSIRHGMTSPVFRFQI